MKQFVYEFSGFVNLMNNVLLYILQSSTWCLKSKLHFFSAKACTSNLQKQMTKGKPKYDLKL